MKFASLEIDTKGAVAIVWMNRPERQNALDAQLIEDLTHALRALDGNASIRVVILAGVGKNFSAGGYPAALKTPAEKNFEDNFDEAKRLAELLRQLANMRQPTIARVQGAALGPGLGLAAACDICVATRGASFGASDVRFGLIPSAISPYVLRAIGPRQALRYFQTGEAISAARAREIGLAHEAVETEKLDSTIGKLVEALLHAGPRATTAAKALIRDLAGAPIDNAVVEETARRIAHLRATDEALEGLAAFHEKRRPKWMQ
jgi:methylglutaconyl-CoA hydratase